MFAKGSRERAQGSARTCVRQSGVEHNLGRRKRGKVEPFSDLDNADRCDTMRQRGDGKAGRHGGDDSHSAASHEDLDPIHASGIEGAGGDIADTA